MDELSRMLGGIEKQLELVLKTQAEDRTASATYRTEIRRDLTTVRETMTDLKNRVNGTADEVAEMQPDIADYRRRRAQAEGASKLTKIIWAVLTSLGLGGIVAIVELFRVHGK